MVFLFYFYSLFFLFCLIFLKNIKYNTNRITDRMSNTNGITNGLNPYWQLLIELSMD